ncbi:MAG: hypothetical protein UU95_C0037G0006 [Parcubacteria group bacterium GW2011_GWC2_42_12]|nr:MAG: hypothetical protein UU95_C0037G0006 [Parcubacteria group bacterium GW2011_GWC2_42_12]
MTGAVKPRNYLKNFSVPLPYAKVARICSAACRGFLAA